MKKPIPKINSSGISHLLIPVIVVVIGVACLGTYLKVNSSARSKNPDWPGLIVIEGHQVIKTIKGQDGKPVQVTYLRSTIGAYRNDIGHITSVRIDDKKADRVNCMPWGKDQQCVYAVRFHGDKTYGEHVTTVRVEKSSAYSHRGLMIVDSRVFFGK